MTEPISDGTMRCPVKDPSGLPCQKRIPEGWTASQGHSGGHWWQDDESAERMRTGHVDARALLAGEPAAVHAPEDCPGPPACHGQQDALTTVWIARDVAGDRRLVFPGHVRAVRVRVPAATADRWRDACDAWDLTQAEMRDATRAATQPTEAGYATKETTTP